MKQSQKMKGEKNHENNWDNNEKTQSWIYNKIV